MIDRWFTNPRIEMAPSDYADDWPEDDYQPGELENDNPVEPEEDEDDE